MAKLFANKFNLDTLASPQKPVETVNQGQAILKQPTLLAQQKQGNPKIDPFGKTINLKDRFRQYTEISSTSHLPEYVLSDKNTGYLDRLLGNQRAGGRFTDQATALRVLENAAVIRNINKQYAQEAVSQGTASITKFPFISQLGREERAIKLTNVRDFQASKLTIPAIQITKVVAGDRIFNPNILIQKIRYDEVSVFNNNLILGVTVIPTFTPALPKTDLIVNPKINVKLTSSESFIIDPKLNIKPLEQIPLERKRLREITKIISIKDEFLTFPKFNPQEQKTINFKAQADGINIVKVKPILQPLTRHGSVSVEPLRTIADEFIVIPKQDFPLTETKRESEQSTKVTPRPMGSIENPEARHGSTNRGQVQYITDEFIQDSLQYTSATSPIIPIGLDELLINPILNALYVSTLNSNTSVGTSMGVQDVSAYYSVPPTFPYNSVEGGNVATNEVRPLFTKYGNVYDDGKSYTQATAQSTSPLKKAGDNSTNGRLEIENSNQAVLQSYSPSQPVIPIDAASRWSSINGTGQTNIPGDYKTLTYADIAARRTSSTRATTDFTLTTGDTIQPWRVRLGMPDDGSGDTLNKSTTATATDLVKLKIGQLQFRAYITNFSDSYSPSYTDVNYIGRPDTLKVYKNSTRSISLGFKVAAFSDKDLKGMYQKLESLVKTGIMATPVAAYAKGPMLRLTIGSWITNAPIVLSSLKYDTNPSEYTWDITHEVPHIVDVSLDCVVLASNDAATPFLTTGTYITYGA